MVIYLTYLIYDKVSNSTDVYELFSYKLSFEIITW